MILLPRPFAAFLLAALIFATPAVRADDGAFRNFIWGVSKEDVRHFETAAFYKEDGNSLYFLLEPDQYRRSIKYDFVNGKLAAARFGYIELTPPTGEMALERFYNEEDELKKRLGDPLKEDFAFKDKTYKNFPQFWGRSLLSKDLQIRIEWVTGGTRTVLWCYHDGLVYQLYYTAEPVAEIATPKTILDLPQRSEPNP